MEKIQETTLPGVGICYDFTTRAGTRVGVVVRSTGRKELVVYAEDDPDAVAESVDLSVEESQVLADFLGNQAIRETTGGIAGLIEGVAVDWVTVPKAAAPRAIGDLQVRSRTGASVVAVVHDGQIDPAPGPDRVLHPGDTVVVVGAPESLTMVVELLRA